MDKPKRCKYCGVKMDTIEIDNITVEQCPLCKYVEEKKNLETK